MLAAAAGHAEEAAAPVSFTKDVAPIFLKHCAACHGPPEVNGGYQVTNYSLLMKPGESESPSITAGSPDESEVVNLISMDDADLRMPKEADPLTADQVALIKRWIVEGAKYDGEDPNASLASIVPTTTQPDPPETYRRPVPITAVAFNQDGSEVAASGYHEVTIWNAADGKLARRDQERCGARLLGGVQPRWVVARGRRRRAGTSGRSEIVQPGRRHIGEGTARHGRRRVLRRVQSGRHQACNRRGRPRHSHH